MRLCGCLRHKVLCTCRRSAIRACTHFVVCQARRAALGLGCSQQYHITAHQSRRGTLQPARGPMSPSGCSLGNTCFHLASTDCVRHADAAHKSQAKRHHAAKSVGQQYRRRHRDNTTVGRTVQASQPVCSTHKHRKATAHGTTLPEKSLPAILLPFNARTRLVCLSLVVRDVGHCTLPRSLRRWVRRHRHKAAEKHIRLLSQTLLLECQQCYTSTAQVRKTAICE